MTVQRDTEVEPQTWRRPGMRGIVDAIYDVLRGIAFMFRSQKPFKLQLAASVLYVALAAWRSVSAIQWVLSVIVIALVMAFETFNTAIEAVCDLHGLEYNPTIKVAKDLAAGAVGFVVFMALGLGAIFLIWPGLI